MATGQRVEVDGLSKSFGDVRAVDALSFTVEPGEITAFLGPNGAGKTTTLRMLLGLIEPTDGTATIGGTPYAELPRPATVVGAALEASSFHPGRSGRDHLRVYCAVNGFADSRADDVLALVGLTDAARRPVRGYSLGMRQRLGLATALLGDPGVLVLDEPANGLDPAGIAWLRGFLKQLADEGRTMLVSSHALSEVQQIADRVVIIDNGHLVRAGRLDELATGGRVLVVTPDAERFAEVLKSSGAVVSRDSAADTLETSGLSAREVGRLAFEHRVELHALETRQDGLEQIFFSLTTAVSQQP
ncbi:ABC-2 type transport system ATP-binding protein [Kribbella voronezhensis]|uniref:ABC-2 type transport system ATP-binding protein n=1 Tax=Kribbella voronezhensis TaxID=2512212 RepID=A0A4R7TE35_9ACTN|nr:ATP-binding cassette domain-containing protein [Kribbella voronezhensis]TDU90410.1 ABC-2 type transport system ATP-binding protein [Kribbella voronezhensis]